MQRTGELLESLLRQRGDALLRTAALLAGGRAAGEDLLQATLEKVMRAPTRLDGDGEAYVRRTMYNLSVDSWRARRRRPEVFADVEPVPQPDTADRSASRSALLAALAELPPRQRAVLVLRFFEDQSEAQTARLLGCSVGTVKSATSRGLDRLRAVTTTWEAPERTHR